MMVAEMVGAATATTKIGLDIDTLPKMVSKGPGSRNNMAAIPQVMRYVNTKKGTKPPCCLDVVSFAMMMSSDVRDGLPAYIISLPLLVGHLPLGQAKGRAR